MNLINSEELETRLAEFYKDLTKELKEETNKKVSNIYEQ